MNPSRRKIAMTLASIAFIGAVILGSVTDAAAWLPASLRVVVHGCVSATVTATNPENQAATVQGGNLWGKGTQIPAHGSITQTVTTSGSYSVTVNYPGDHTLRTASIQVNIPSCPTTTTTSSSSTTTSSTSPPPPDTPSTPAPPAAIPAPPVELTPSFTG